MKLEIGIAGISGRIGQRLVEIIDNDNKAVVACGLVSKHSSFALENIEIASQCQQADIWIDFSVPNAFEKVLAHCVENKSPLVSGTTGLSKKHYVELENAAQHIPILWASNFALSINLIRHLLSSYTKLQGSTIKITETHHTHKADKPSGTAITLAKTIKPHGMIKRIDDDNFLMDDIKIKSIREGEVPGIHNIELENNNESLAIIHTAKDPIIFAKGALDVAKWLIKQKKGFYTMSDYIESLP